MMRINKYFSGLIFVFLPAICFTRRYDDPWDYSGGPGVWIVWFNVLTIIAVFLIIKAKLAASINYGEPAASFFARWYRYGVVLSSISIVLAFFDMPSGYYIYVLRPILTGAAVLGVLALLREDKSNEWFFWVLVVFALLHNPVRPIILGDKAPWVILNIIYIALLWYLETNIFKDIEGDHHGKISKVLSQKREEEQKRTEEQAAQNETDRREESDMAEEESDIGTRQSREYTTTTPPFGYVLWNPNTVSLWCLIFTPIFGSWLIARNWEGLGDDIRRQGVMKWFYLSILMLIPLFFVPFLGLIYLLIWYFVVARPQINYIAIKFGDEYEKKEWLAPIGVGASIYASIFALFYYMVNSNNSYRTPRSYVESPVYSVEQRSASSYDVEKRNATTYNEERISNREFIAQEAARFRTNYASAYGGRKDLEQKLRDISGVWAGAADGAIVTIKLLGTNKLITIGRKVFPVDVKDYDHNKSVLTLYANGDVQQIWTVRQVYSSKNRFTLHIRMNGGGNDGVSDDLSYVRDVY